MNTKVTDYMFLESEDIILSEIMQDVELNIYSNAQKTKDGDFPEASSEIRAFAPGSFENWHNHKKYPDRPTFPHKLVYGNVWCTHSEPYFLPSARNGSI